MLISWPKGQSDNALAAAEGSRTDVARAGATAPEPAGGSRNLAAFLQVVGAGCLVIVVLTHICETLGLFAWMHWGLKSSAGHYLDFWSAAIGLTLFSGGYLFHSLTHRHA